jgi:hypothetical protein
MLFRLKWTTSKTADFPFETDHPQNRRLQNPPKVNHPDLLKALGLRLRYLLSEFDFRIKTRIPKTRQHTDKKPLQARSGDIPLGKNFPQKKSAGIPKDTGGQQDRSPVRSDP